MYVCIYIYLSLSLSSCLVYLFRVKHRCVKFLTCGIYVVGLTQGMDGSTPMCRQVVAPLMSLTWSYVFAVILHWIVPIFFLNVKLPLGESEGHGWRKFHHWQQSGSECPHRWRISLHPEETYVPTIGPVSKLFQTQVRKFKWIFSSPQGQGIGDGDEVVFVNVVATANRTLFSLLSLHVYSRVDGASQER